MKKHFFIPLGIIVFALQGCMTTQFSATWKDSEYKAKNYKNLLVWALSDNLTARSTVEDEVTYFLNLKKIRATSGSDILPSDRKVVPKEKEVVRKRLLKAGYDAVLTIGVVDIKEETYYVQGEGYYNPMAYAYYGSFYGYYPYMYGSVYQPGYYSSNTVVYLESNLWNVETGKLVWSGQSKSTKDGTIDKLANSYARAVVNELLKKGLLIPKPKVK